MHGRFPLRRMNSRFSTQQDAGAPLGSRIFVWIAGFLTVFMLPATITMTPPLVQLWQSRSFMSTTGELLESSVVRIPESRSRSYRIDCLYRYRVNGIAHEGRIFRFGSSFGQRRSAEDALYSVRSTYPLIVYYDEHAPERSVLFNQTTHTDRATICFLIVGSCLVMVCWAIVVAKRVRRARI